MEYKREILERTNSSFDPVSLSPIDAGAKFLVMVVMSKDCLAMKSRRLVVGW